MGSCKNWKFLLFVEDERERERERQGVGRQMMTNAYMHACACIICSLAGIRRQVYTVFVCLRL